MDSKRISVNVTENIYENTRTSLKIIFFYVTPCVEFSPPMAISIKFKITGGGLQWAYAGARYSP